MTATSSSGSAACPAGVSASTWSRVRFNPWARTVAVVAGPDLERRGADYVGCGVRDDGTRALSWAFPRGQLGAPRGRYRRLVFRGLGGSRNNWEITYREERGPRFELADLLEMVRLDGLLLHHLLPVRPVHHYSMRSRRVTVDQISGVVHDLIEDGLLHRRRPVGDCGC